MEKSTKLEDVREYVKRKGHVEGALHLLLKHCWPFSDSKEGKNMSAMDCLIVVFRHIYGHIYPRDALDGTVTSNELLTFALSNFGAETPEELKEELAARASMYGIIVKDWKLGENPSFSDLSESESMFTSIWAHDSFRLSYPIMHKWTDADAWSYLPDEREQTVLEARQSLVVWDTSQHERLEDVLEDKFGRFEGRLKEFGKDKVQYFMANKSPVVMRVKLLPKKKLDNFNINTIREFKFPAHIPTVRSATGGARTRRTVQYSEGEPQSYLLMAIVKLRGSETGRDRVRLYDFLGTNIVPYIYMAETGGYVDNSWLVEHQDSPYMLYYFRNKEIWRNVQDEVEEEGAVDEPLKLMPETSVEDLDSETEDPASVKEETE